MVSGRGGKRRGAGRPPRSRLGRTREISIALPEPIVAWIDRRVENSEDLGASRSRAIAEILERSFRASADREG